MFGNLKLARYRLIFGGVGGMQVVSAMVQLVAQLERARCNTSGICCISDIRRSQSSTQPVFQ